MKALPLSALAALCAAFFSLDVAAQSRIEARPGLRVSPRLVTGAVQVGHDHGRGSNRGRGSDRNRGFEDRSRSHGGHWETVCEQVLVPGYWTEQHVPPSYGWIYSSCGHRQWGLIDRGGCRRIWVPARYETRHRQVWVRC